MDEHTDIDAQADAALGEFMRKMQGVKPDLWLASYTGLQAQELIRVRFELRGIRRALEALAARQV